MTQIPAPLHQEGETPEQKQDKQDTENFKDFFSYHLHIKDYLLLILLIHLRYTIKREKMSKVQQELHKWIVKKVLIQREQMKLPRKGGKEEGYDTLHSNPKISAKEGPKGSTDSGWQCRQLQS